MTIRIDHTASSAAYDTLGNSILLRSRCKIPRIRILCNQHIAVDDKTASFQCNMTDRMLPFRIVIRIAGNIDRNPLLIQRRPCKRHVPLPADQAADRPPRRIHHREISLIRIAPDHTLRARRLELPVRQDFTIRGNQKIGIIKRPVNSIPFRNADAYIHAKLPGLFLQHFRLFLTHNNGCIRITLPVLPAISRTTSHRKA